MKKAFTPFLAVFFFIFYSQAWAWHDETHLAIAKAAGYEKWYNAAGADITKIKAGNTPYNAYNRKNHVATDGIIEAEVLYNLPLIEVYPINIESEADLASEVAKIANLSINLGNRLEMEDRIISRQEAYKQISHSASLFRAILKFVGKR
jgi:hypothetical protein